MKIRPARSIRGELRLPGDKSISHRAAIISAMSLGSARISNFATSQDCFATLSCLRELGVNIELEGTDVTIEGVGLRGFRAPSRPLDCGNSGSTMRLLAGVLAGQDFDSTLTGDDSLRSRPMQRIIEPLELMGARIKSEAGRAPLHIIGRKVLKAISYQMPVESAQVKACILLAGLNAKGLTKLIEKPNTTRDHTERMLRWIKAKVGKTEVETDGCTMDAISVEGRTQFKAHGGTVPGDISTAAFFTAAASMLPGATLRVDHVGMNPTRTGILTVLRSFGIDLRLDSVKSDDNWAWPEFLDFDEPIGSLEVAGGAGLAPTGPKPSNVLRGNIISQVIDELPMLAVLGSQVVGGISIRDASELRLKESDRIRATVENLRAMGANVEEHEDGLTIPQRTSLRGARLNSHNDHRIAMAFTIAALVAEGESEIVGADCVGVSFPKFFEVLESVVVR